MIVQFYNDTSNYRSLYHYNTTCLINTTALVKYDKFFGTIKYSEVTQQYDRIEKYPLRNTVKCHFYKVSTRSRLKYDRIYSLHEFIAVYWNDSLC